MTRYTLQVQLPSLGWVVAIKTSDLFYMASKRARLIAQGHKVKLTKENKNDWEFTNTYNISFYVLFMLWSSFNNTW